MPTPDTFVVNPGTNLRHPERHHARTAAILKRQYNTGIDLPSLGAARISMETTPVLSPRRGAALDIRRHGPSIQLRTAPGQFCHR